jgi:catechol 2,3-dioxygenase-like lactoylglutathione lyase family enzyme
MTNPKPCAVVFCAQHEKVLAFYRDALGLPVVHHEDSHSVLDASGLQLVVHPLPDTILCAPDPVTRRWDCTLKLMFLVASIAEARTKAGPLGGVIDPPEAEWTWQDRRCCKGHDPAGNVFEVLAPA